MFCETNKNKFGFLAAIVFVVLVFWLGVDVINKLKVQVGVKNTIVVAGTGEVFVKPDLAITTFSVVTEAKTVGAALAENTQKMNAVINFLKSKGIQGKDLKTTNFSIFPRYEFQKVELEIYPYPPGKRVLTGYEVQQSLEVKIRDLTKTGEFIEGAASSGANQAGDLRFTVENEETFQAQARKDAIDKAQNKAKELASQLGVRLGKITNFSESGFFIPPFFGLKEAAQAGGSAPQIQTGENKISVTVNITYEIK